MEGQGQDQGQCQRPAVSSQVAPFPPTWSSARFKHEPAAAQVKLDGDADKWLLYNITKAAVLHGTKLQAAEPLLTSRGVTVVAVCPGWCRVRFHGLQSRSTCEYCGGGAPSGSAHSMFNPGNTHALPCSFFSRHVGP